MLIKVSPSHNMKRHQNLKTNYHCQQNTTKKIWEKNYGRQHVLTQNLGIKDKYVNDVHHY
ncbi:hypothetical protein NC651_036807 [Populus alba x Populus x berolinensis]|nr:hypothetical protein NC651_036807 [Populus alba x Populus x berolinensis]